ncbi:metal ABC transporter permease [Comamonas sp. Y6]|uniref:Metal ABC transporter permease n=1 Tax=Comamonas resistens TaxID=3046670 RepID=A0ABY8STG6_9BURK|nr:metal ABC transporter permease [Comamonas resistens]MDL5038429.1 metal ABC transporter permease [Comamonas resistens]WHS64581.1 metal ABC transporter permease [Comamonas resistens]
MIGEIWSPFAEYGFMRRALAGCLALSAGAAPLGTILLLRRMSLVGDAMSHAILPGAALGYLIFGLSLPAMSIGGLLAGLLVALLSGVVTRHTALREDASFAGFYLISLALGVLLISLRGSNVDLLHVLFGSVLALDDPTLLLTASIATVSLLALALIYRPLIVECFDPGFLRLQGRQGELAHAVFMALLVLNLVGGFHSLGTLMSVAFVVLPAAAARFWVRGVGPQMAMAVVVAVLGSVIGLLVSFHVGIAASAAITLSLGSLYALSLSVGPLGSVLAHRRQAAEHIVRLKTGVSP